MYTYLIRIKSARIGAKAIPIQANNEEEGIKDFCERFLMRYILEDCWYQDFSIERVKDKEVAEKLKVNG